MTTTKMTIKMRTTALRAALAAVMVAAAACTKDVMDNINARDYNPADAAARYLVTELLTQTAFTSVGGDFSLYASIYVEHETGTWNQMWNADQRAGEPSLATTYNNVWDGTYNNVKLAKLVISKCQTEGSADYGNAVTLGIGQVMLAYNGALLTDLFGDVPFFEAGESLPSGAPLYMQPSVDKQQDIYTKEGGIFSLLDAAIENFKGRDLVAAGAKDLYYSGNAARWTKAAYGLKARYTMRLGANSPDGTNYLGKVAEYADKSFANAGEEMKFAVYDGSVNINPLFGFSSARDALGASQSLLALFTSSSDPRADQFFFDWNAGKNGEILPADKVESAPNGDCEQQQFQYSLMAANYASSSPTQLLSYHEVLFLKAEALARDNNKAGEAKDALQKAVVAALAAQQKQVKDAIATLGADTDEDDIDFGGNAADYFDNQVAARFDQSAVKEVVLQKYLAFAGAAGESVEAYNDYRRVKYLDGKDNTTNSVSLANAKNTSQFPHRFSYGNSDVISNPKVKVLFTDEGRYVYAEKVWWAGGTR